MFVQMMEGQGAEIKVYNNGAQNYIVITGGVETQGMVYAIHTDSNGNVIALEIFLDETGANQEGDSYAGAYGDGLTVADIPSIFEDNTPKAWFEQYASNFGELTTQGAVAEIIAKGDEFATEKGFMAGPTMFVQMMEGQGAEIKVYNNQTSNYVVMAGKMEDPVYGAQGMVYAIHTDSNGDVIALEVFLSESGVSRESTDSYAGAYADGLTVADIPNIFGYNQGGSEPENPENPEDPDVTYEEGVRYEYGTAEFNKILAEMQALYDNEFTTDLGHLYLDSGAEGTTEGVGAIDYWSNVSDYLGLRSDVRSSLSPGYYVEGYLSMQEALKLPQIMKLGNQYKIVLQKIENTGSYFDSYNTASLIFNKNDNNELENALFAFADDGQYETGPTTYSRIDISRTVENGFNYLISEGNAYIVAVQRGGGEIVFPSTVEGNIPVVGIGLYGNVINLENYSSITIPASVNTIRQDACNNGNLVEIIVHEENATFKDDNGRALLSKNGETLYYYAGQSGTEYAIPNGVIAIESGAFRGELTSIEIPASVTTISDGAFASVLEETAITVEPANPVYAVVASEEYKDKFALIEIATGKVIIDGLIGNLTVSEEEPEALNSTEGYSYQLVNGKAYITSVPAGNGELAIPSELTPVQPQAQTVSTFGLRNQMLRTDSSQKVLVYGLGNGTDAIENLSQYTSVAIPESVTSIKASAFAYFSNTIITFAEGCIISSLEMHAFNNCTAIIYGLVLGGGITEIPEFAFNYCQGLTSIEIPSTVTTISNRAFSNCTAMITFAEGSVISSLGIDAFNSCYNLKSITLGGGISEIPSGSFFHCSSLSSIEIPESVRIIGSGALSSCLGLNSIKISGNIETIATGAFETSNITNLIIGKNVTSLPGNIFTSHLVFVTDINNEANLNEAITLGTDRTWTKGSETLTKISASGVYSGLYAGEGITEDGWRYVSDGYNYYISGAPVSTEPNSTLVIPNKLTLLNGDEVNVYGIESGFDRSILNITNYTTVIISEGIVEVGYFAFYACDYIISIEIPSSVKYIETSAFSRCVGLTSIEIKSNITTIGTAVFNACTNLTTLNIGENVTSLPADLFTNNNLTNLTTINCNSDNLDGKALPSGTWLWDGEVVDTFVGSGVYTKQA